MNTSSNSIAPPQPWAEDVLSGDGEAVRRLRLQISRIAPHFRTVLVTGERGVGKDMVSRELHRLSGTEVASGPLQRMDIAAFAQGNQPVELSGLLLLRGLDRLQPSLQEKAVLGLRSVQRVLRIVVISECELRLLLASGRMLQNLASRIGSLEIRVPSLRDRADDLELITTNMLRRSQACGRIGAEALEALKQHSWQGNFKELWDVVQHVSQIEGDIEPHHLPTLVPRVVDPEAGARLDRVMQRHVFEVLERCKGNKLRAAELLGISRSTLYRMLDAAVEQSAEKTTEAALALIERQVREGPVTERRVALG